MSVDLRSDTVTRPTPDMREAMAQAAVGDDVYGEDPTVGALQEQVADLLGHEAGLFMPTGSLANQIGMRLHVGEGQEFIADSLAHVLRAELGAGAALGGMTSRTWQAERGLVDPEVVLRLMIPEAGPYQVSTALVVLENTHNFGGGTVQPLSSLRTIREATADVGVRTHLDGARLWNAHVATGVPLRDYGACFDTVSVCFSKGLGAPVGSMLVGSAEAMTRARVLRKRYGAGMRQVGILAAAARHALEFGLTDLAEDHRRAASVARAVADTHPEVVGSDDVRTNIVLLDVGAAGWSAPDAVHALAAAGVQAYATDPRHLRLVWHRDVDDAATELTREALLALLAGDPLAASDVPRNSAVLTSPR